MTVMMILTYIDDLCFLKFSHCDDLYLFFKDTVNHYDVVACQIRSRVRSYRCQFRLELKMSRVEPNLSELDSI